MQLDGSITLDGSHITLVVLEKEPSGKPLLYIQNPTPGQQICLSILNGSNALTVDGSGAGDILLQGGTCLLSSPFSTLLLIHKPGVNMWLELTRQTA